MFELPVTKESYKFLVLIYQEYLQRRDTMSKNASIFFDKVPDFVHVHIAPEDCHSCLVELKAHNYIRLYVDGGFLLTNNAIMLMENRFRKGASEIAEVLSKFI